MKENKPWYVRFTNFMWGPSSTRNGCIIPVMVIILVILIFAISFGIAKNKPIEPYEEAYDVKFKTYVNGILEDISTTLIDKENRVILEEIPENVLEYDIRRTKQGIELICLLDKEKVISDYYLETGETPIFSYSEPEHRFEMKIQISNDFKNIVKTSSIPIPTRYEYEKNYPRTALINNTVQIALTLIVALVVIFIIIVIFSIGPAIATCVWKRKQQKLS